MSWEKVRLAEIASMSTGKLDSNAATPDGEYPFFTCSQQTLRINEPAFDTEAVLLGGNNAAGIFPLKYYKGQFNAYQRTYIIESLNPDVLNIRFLYYALRPALSYFQSASIGAATQYLTKGILENFRVALPSTSEQDRIASILSAYDDLIENNRRRIRLLEQAARLLYSEWFVRLRFPGHEHVRIRDGVPEGWERKTLKDICERIDYGYTASSSEERIGPKFLRITDIVPNSIEWDNVPYCEIPEKKIGKYELKEGDIVIARTGATVGYAKRINKRHPQSVFASYLVRIKINPRYDNSYIGLIVESDNYKKFIKSNISGAAQPQANAQVLTSYSVLIPSKNIQDLFNHHVRDIFDLREAFQVMNSFLSQCRDLLLPRLMNGEIAV